MDVGVGLKPALNKCRTELASAAIPATASTRAPLRERAELSGITSPLSHWFDRGTVPRSVFGTLRACECVIWMNHDAPGNHKGRDVFGVEALDEPKHTHSDLHERITVHRLRRPARHGPLNRFLTKER